MEDIGRDGGKNAACNKKVLHFGCMIYLCFCEEDGTDFYSYAEGFTKNKLRLKTQDQMKEEGSFTSGLYKIYPNFYNNEYLKTKKKQEEKKHSMNKQLSPIEKREARSEIPRQIKQMEEETSLNFDQYEKMKSTPILYGQTIQFLHNNSNKFLVYDLNHVSDYESDNLKIGLKDEYSEETCFRILPCFSYQQESQGYIYDDDIVYIVSTIDHYRKMAGEPYLHASKTRESLKTQKKKKEMNVSTDKKSSWKIKIFCEYIEEKKGLLSVCDIIWINFSEQDLNLIVQKQSEEEESGHKKKHNLLFESCQTTEKYKKFIGNSNGMFVIESESMQQGGNVEWEGLYHLRHLTTNCYLSLGDDMQQNSTSEVLMEEHQRSLILKDNVNQATLFKFELIYSTLSSRNRAQLTKFMQRDSYFRMLSIKQEGTYWLKTADPEEQFDIQNNSMEDEQDILNSQEKFVIPVFSTIKKEENVFKLARANANEVRMTNFLLSCMKTLKSTFEFLTPDFLLGIENKEVQFQQMYKRFLIRVGRLEKCLIDLNLFCHNKLLAYLYVDQEYGSINCFIQNVLREQLFIELLVKLLVISFPKVENLKEIIQIEQEKKKKQEYEEKILRTTEEARRKQEVTLEIKEEFVSKKKKICSYIYLLLSSICENNIKNQEKSQKYLPIFAMQSKYIPAAMECIVSIISNYEELLLTLHKEGREDQNPLSIEQFAGTGGGAGAGSVAAKKHQEKTKLKKPVAGHINVAIQNTSIEARYTEPYERFIKSMIQYNYQYRERWDLIQFFTTLLKDTDDLNSKRELLRFLGMSSIYRQQGLNVNQELIYRYMLGGKHEDQVFDKGWLIRIKSDGPTLIVFVNEEQRKLIDIVVGKNLNRIQQQQAGGGALQQQIDLMDQQQQQIQNIDNQEGKDMGKKHIEDVQVLPFICDQIDFYSNMCNSRNYTWKKFVENSCNFDSLVASILDSKFSCDIRAIIARLLNKLYVDQEPRRIQQFPELCKVVKIAGKYKRGDSINTATSEDKKEKERVDQGLDLVNVEEIKKNLLKYVVQKMEEIEKMSTIIGNKPEKGAEKDTKRHQQVIELSQGVYNNLTFEMLKLLKLIISFGKYNIKMGSSSDETQIKNKDFFTLIKSLIAIFEFDKTYPEARNILIEKRKEKKKKEQQAGVIPGAAMLSGMMGLLSKGVGMFNVFSVLSGDDQAKKKKKKAGNLEFALDDMSLGESFLKQTDVLKKILTKFFSDDTDDIEFRIKQEICDILNQYLDYKQDFMLTNLKYIFKDCITELKFEEKINQGTFTLGEREVSEIKEKFKQHIKQKIAEILPPILETGTKVDETNEKLKSQPKNRKDDAININKIIDFDIFPALINLFCFTQNVQMEKKILSIMCRFYNQRSEFAKLSSRLLILFDEQNIQVLKLSKKKIKILAKNVDESETWMQNLDNQKHALTLQETLRHFTFFTDLLFANSFINDGKNNASNVIQLGSLFPPQQQRGDPNSEVIKTQDREVDPIRQEIMRHIEVYQLAVTLIKDSIHVFEDTPPELRDQLQLLFEQCFKFLRLFVTDNVQNQNLLSENLVSLLVNMNLDMGQIEMFCEIFRNNKKICTERYTELTDDFINIIRTNGRQAKFLEFFAIIQHCRGEFILNNQKHVLNLFLDPKLRHHLLFVKEIQVGSGGGIAPGFTGNMASSVSNINITGGVVGHQKTQLVFDFDSEGSMQQKENPHFKDEPFQYHSKLIELLALTTIGKEGMIFSESRLRSVLPLRYLFELLSSPDEILSGVGEIDMIGEEQKLNNNLLQSSFQNEGMSSTSSPFKFNFPRQQWDAKGITQLKIPLLKYIYYTFLESEKISDEFMKYFEDFVKFINCECERLKRVQALPADASLPATLNEYFYDNFVFIINAYLRCFNKEVQSEQKAQNETASQVNAALQNLQTQIQATFERMNLTSSQVINVQIFYSLMEGEHESARELEKRIAEDPPFHTNMKILLGQQIVSQKSLDAQGLKGDRAWKTLWQFFLEEFLNSDILKDEIESERMVFAEALDKVEEIFKKDNLIAEIVNKTELFKKIINFLQKSHNEEDNISTFKQLMISLGNYISIKDEANNPDLDEEQREEVEQEEKEAHQNFLNQNNAIYMTLSLMSDYSNPKLSDQLFNDLIVFGIQILDGGNHDVQKSIYNYFLNFTSSEVFFMRIHERIHEEINILKHKITPTPGQQQAKAAAGAGAAGGAGGAGAVAVPSQNPVSNQQSQPNLKEQQQQQALQVQQQQQQPQQQVVVAISLQEEDEEHEKTYNFEAESDIITNILRFLQLFAEGHYLELQNYMRSQTQNYHNYDLIGDIIELLSHYFKAKNQCYIENMMQCFDTLTECIQGPCYENQMALIQDNFLDLASNLLGIDELMEEFELQIKKKRLQEQAEEAQRRGQSTKQILAQALELESYLPKYMISRLKYKCSITLISLLEARKDDDIVKRMMKSLNMDILKRNMADIYHLYRDVGGNKYTPDLFLHFNVDPNPEEPHSYELASFIIETGFNIFIVFSNFIEASKDAESESMQKEEEEEENLLKDSIIGKLINLTMAIIRSLQETALEQARKMKEMMTGKETLTLEQKKLRLTQQRTEYSKLALKFFQKNTLHIEVLREDKQLEKAYFYCPPFCRSLDKETKTKFNREANRISVKAKVTSLMQEKDQLIKVMKHNYWLNTQLEKFKVLMVLAENIDLLRDVAFLLAITINILVLVSYERRGPNDESVVIFDNVDSAITTMGTIVIVLSSIIVAYFLARTAPLLIMQAWVGVKNDKLNIFAYIKRLLMTVYYLLSDFYVLYYGIYILTAIVGLVITPFFFFYHLFDVLVRYPVLLNVVKAVWNPRKSIMFTYFLFIVLMYVFTLFGYYWLKDSYPSNFCESTWTCLITAIDRSFKVDGGIGGFLTPSYEAKPGDVSYFLIRFFFDNIYFILLMIIMINIVSGIIIDTFGSLREELKEYLEDLEHICFICGHDSEYIEKNSDNNRGFKQHIKQDHYMWNYLYYMAYLLDKDETEYTGIESYVADKLERGEISWFPTFRSLYLKENSEGHETQELVQSLEEIQQQQEKLKEILDDINTQVDKIEADKKSN